MNNFEHQWGLKVNRFDQVSSGGHQMSVVGGPRPVPRASGESHVWRGHGGGDRGGELFLERSNARWVMVTWAPT